MRCKTKHLARAYKKPHADRLLTVLKSVITADIFFFHRKPRVNGCNNRKPLSAMKPQYREFKWKLPQNRTKNNAKPNHRKPLRPPSTNSQRFKSFDLPDVTMFSFVMTASIFSRLTSQFAYRFV